MDRNFRNQSLQVGESPPSGAWLFAQAIQGKSVPNVSNAQAEAQARREQLEWLAQISTKHERILRSQLSAQADARAERAQLEWLAAISTRHERQLRSLLTAEAEAREALQRAKRFAETSNLQEWDSAKHPRRGGSPNAGWFAATGGGGSDGANAWSSVIDRILRRNSTLANLSGVVTPGMIRANRLAAELQSAVRLPSEVASAAAAGLGTGGKAVVNGFATAVKDVTTLGLSPGQLELIGVTKEDRDRGYDTAVAISTGSGQVLIAAGTDGMASALSKGGSVARAASGALIVYDAAGNAVGVAQGVYDAGQNGVTIANGVKIAGGALGLGANLSAAKSLTTPGASTPTSSPTTSFLVGKHGDMPSPRPGQHSHHGVMSAWMKKTFPGYDSKKAPAILIPDTKHHATYSVYNKWRAEMARKLGGTFDWSKVSEADMRALSEKIFDAAQIPANVRKQYWTEFEKMRAALRRQRASESLEESIWARHQIF